MIINKLIFFIFLLGLLNPVSGFSNTEKPDNQPVEIQSGTPISAVTAEVQFGKDKKVLTGNRELGPFFTIGLAINLIMMVTFAVWAVGQFRQHKKNKK